MRDHWVLSVSRRTSTILVWVTCPCTKCECSWFLCRAKYLEAHGAFRKPLEGFCRAPSSGGYSVCSGFSNALQGCTLTLYVPLECAAYICKTLLFLFCVVCYILFLLNCINNIVFIIRHSKQTMTGWTKTETCDVLLQNIVGEIKWNKIKVSPQWAFQPIFRAALSSNFLWHKLLWFNDTIPWQIE